jgi:predicted nucleic acid-binding protein
MKLLVDTSILLHDFYYRYPEMASRRQNQQSDQLFAWREVVHQSLIATAETSTLEVATPLFALYRLAGILSEYFVPNALVRQEFQYLSHNYHLLSETEAQLEGMIGELQNWGDDDGVDADLLLLEAIAVAYGCQVILTTNTRGLTNSPKGIFLYTSNQWIAYLKENNTI